MRAAKSAYGALGFRKRKRQNFPAFTLEISCSDRRAIPIAHSRKSDPAPSPGHAEPQSQRDDRRRFTQQRIPLTELLSNDPALKSEGENDRQGERAHLEPKRKAVIALRSFGKK